MDLKEYCDSKSKEFVGLKILEALSGTGLWSVRYAKEIGAHALTPEVNVKKILTNDWDGEAFKLISKNFEFNKLSCETEVT